MFCVPRFSMRISVGQSCANCSTVARWSLSACWKPGTAAVSLLACCTLSPRSPPWRMRSSNIGSHSRSASRLRSSTLRLPPTAKSGTGTKAVLQGMALTVDIKEVLPSVSTTRPLSSADAT